MKKTKTPQTPQLQEPDTQSKRRLSLPKVAYSAFLCVMMSMIFCQPAYAATDVWTKAKEIMQDVYTQILAISTIAAIVTASVALLLMNFSRSGRTVDESRAWLKRICITWAIPAAAGEWGLPVSGCTTAEPQLITDALANGKLVVAIMSEGHFTSSGHFIVLRGVKDGKIMVADPASYTRSEQLWDLSIILNEASRRAGAGGPFWIIG